MLRWLPLLLLPLLQDPGVDDLLQGLEKANYYSLDAAIDALVAKGDGVEPAVRQRTSAAGPEFLRRLALVLRRLELQRKLKELHPPPKPIEYDVSDKPISEVVADLEKWLGLPVAREGLPDLRVTLRVSGVNSLQALDAFHKATGYAVSPVDTRTYDQVRSLHVLGAAKAKLSKQPYSTWPSCGPGRFRVSATSTRVERVEAKEGPGSFGAVDLLVQCPYSAQPHDMIFFTVKRIADDQGRELALIPDVQMPGPRMGVGAPRLSLAKSFRFARPQSDAKSVSMLGCRIRVGYAVEQNYLTFDRPEDSVGATLDCDGAKVTLKEFQLSSGWIFLVLDQSGHPGIDIAKLESFEYRDWQLLGRIEAVHADGRVTVPENRGARQEGPVYRKRMNCFSEPKVVAIRIPLKASFAYEDLEFDLRDIPLPGVK